MLDKAEMHGIEIEQMEKAYEGLRLKPDNTSALFQFAKGLYLAGFRAHAISVASSALGSLSTEIDQVGNKSVRDAFRAEENMLRNWRQEAAAAPSVKQSLRCPSCGTVNEPGPILCSRCGEPYLLYIARKGDTRVGIVNKLLIAWAATAVFFIGFVVIALNFEGVVRLLLLALAFISVGIFLTKLFSRQDAYRV
jgi:hypothetical protein